jgi:putative transposase
MIKAFQYQLHLKGWQEASLKRWSGALRWLCNRAVEEQQARHARSEKYSNYIAMANWLSAWRNHPDTVWLAEGPLHPQQQALKEFLSL